MFSLLYKKYSPIILTLFCVATLTLSATQAQAFADIIPAAGTENETFNIEDETHPPIKLTPDKSMLIQLDKKITSIIIGNPLHLSVLAEAGDALVLVGKMPGATHFIALDNESNVVMQRRVIVAAPSDNYVRIRKSCVAAGSDLKNCVDTQMYYCPDMCHETIINKD